MSEDKILNGVNITTMENVVNDMKEDPGLAKCKFRLKNKWVNGGHNHGTVGDFYAAKQEISHLNTLELDADEPPFIAGTDLVPNPVEHLLNALSACMTTALVYHAALRGIEIEELESELEGDLDMRGFLGLSDDVRRGYENIRVKFKVKTDEDNLKRLKALSKLSPVFDVTSNGTNIDVQIERK